MKVYIVDEEYDLEHHEIVRVYSTFEKALEYSKNRLEKAKIEIHIYEWNVDEQDDGKEIYNGQTKKWGEIICIL